MDDADGTSPYLSAFADELLSISDGLKRKAAALAAREEQLQRQEREQLLRQAAAAAGAGAVEGEEEETAAEDGRHGRRRQQHDDQLKQDRRRHGGGGPAGRGQRAVYVAELEGEVERLRGELAAALAEVGELRRRGAEAAGAAQAGQAWLADGDGRSAAGVQQLQVGEAGAGRGRGGGRRERQRTQAQLAALQVFTDALFEIAEQKDAESRDSEAGRKASLFLLLPRRVRADPAVYAHPLPDHSAFVKQAFSCIPDLMTCAAVVGNTMQQRFVEFLWFSVRALDHSTASVPTLGRRRLMGLLAVSLEDPEGGPRAPDPYPFDPEDDPVGPDSAVWCSSHDMVIACLSLLLVLRIGTGPNAAEGHAGAGGSAAAGEARLLARALTILQLLIETAEGKRLFLLYRGPRTHALAALMLPWPGSAASAAATSPLAARLFQQSLGLDYVDMSLKR